MSQQGWPAFWFDHVSRLFYMCARLCCHLRGQSITHGQMTHATTSELSYPLRLCSSCYGLAGHGIGCLQKLMIVHLLCRS